MFRSTYVVKSLRLIQVKGLVWTVIYLLFANKNKEMHEKYFIFFFI